MAGAFDRRGTLQPGLKHSARIDPQLIVHGQLLQLSQAELEQAIERELTENPALERLEDDSAEVSYEEVVRAVAPQESRPATEDREVLRSYATEDGVEWTDLAAAEEDLGDYVRGQLDVSAPARLREILEYLVGSLNERGYLECSLEEAALACDASLEDAEEALGCLQACEPAGIGARDLRECLMLQLRHPATDAERLARDLVALAWDSLVRRATKAVARKFRATQKLAEEAFEVVSSLQPYPAEGIARKAASRAVAGARPDLCIRLDQSGWIVEATGPDERSVCVNRYYRERLAEVRSFRGSTSEKRHLAEYVERADRFVEALAQRRRTLVKIGEVLLERQAGFVRTGDVRFLVPLTRSELAKLAGVHESTVSRATNKKFLQIATGEVVAFETLFKPALRIQQKIAEILANEHPDRPLSDAAIAEILASQGIVVARRTVNKYRDRSRLLSSRKRKSA
jgi:RNA polymerase sigma-54 factor